MRIYLRGLTMTAVLLSTTAAFANDQTTRSFVGDSDAEYYGDTYSDADSDDSEQGTVTLASATAFAGDAHDPSMSTDSMPMAYAPQYEMSNYPPEYSSDSSFSDSSGGSSCGGGCNDGCRGGCKPRGRMSQAMSGKCPEVWLQAETLLWFPQARTNYPLAVTTDPGTEPLLTTPGATRHGESFGNDLTPGFRGDIGRYFADGAFGIGGRFWILSEDGGSFALADNGTNQSIGRPFNNIGGPPVDSGIIAFQPGGPNGFQGSIAAQESLDILAAEAYGRFNFAKSSAVHMDLIGGYSFFSIDNELAIQSQTSRLPGTGGMINFTDRFNTNNDFHGGQIGAETILRRGRWVARSLTKVHLGNMHQQVNYAGTGVNSASNISPLLPFGDGFLAGGVDPREVNRDVFTFAPEFNFKLGYRFRDHVTFSAGYTFLYWNNVAMAGNQIDPNLEFTNAGVSARGLPASVRDAGFWVQGIDLGTTIEF